MVARSLPAAWAATVSFRCLAAASFSNLFCTRGLKAVTLSNRLLTSPNAHFALPMVMATEVLYFTFVLWEKQVAGGA